MINIKNSGLTRREFVTLASHAAGLAMLGGPLMGSMIPSRAFAQKTVGGAREPHLLLNLRIKGSWDVMMATDAKQPDTVRGEGIQDNGFLFINGRVPDGKLGSALLGKSMQPLKKYLPEIAVINGIVMVRESSSHDVNLAYMSSGSTEASTAYAPFLFSKSGGRIGDRVAHQIQDGDLRDGGYIKKIPLAELSQARSNTSPYDMILTQVAMSLSNDDTSQSVLIREQAAEKDALARLQALNQQRANQRLGSGTQGMNAALLAISGFGSGYIQSAVCDFTAQATQDTHNNHDARQGRALSTVFSDLAILIELMKNTPFTGEGSNALQSVFDVTTVVVTSDFSRTSAPEGGDGTGHNQYCNSAIVFGKNIAGGQSIGSSDVWSKKDSRFGGSLLHGNLFDFKKQRSLSKADTRTLVADSSVRGEIGKPSSDLGLDYIYPEAIWRTLGTAFGLERIAGIDPGPQLTGLLKA